jgi:hypothetical protein
MTSNVIKSEHGTKMKETKQEVDTTPGDTNILASTSHSGSDAGNASAPTAHENLHGKPHSKSEETQPKSEDTQPKSEDGKNTGYVFKEPSEDDDNYDKEKGQPKPKYWEKDDGMRGDKYHPPGSWYLGSGVWIEPSHPLY